MALTTTTLSAAVGINDTNINVTSATGFAANNLIWVDQEMMQVTKAYVSGTLIPVLRGRGALAQIAHVKSANVTTGLASDFSAAPIGSADGTYPLPRIVQIISISATSSLTLPASGEDMRVILNGTSVITLTVPVPTKDMDGVMLTILSNGAAAHVITFTSTLNNAGSGYTSFTNNSSGTMALVVYACNGFWTVPCFPAWTGTVTKVTGGIA